MKNRSKPSHSLFIPVVGLVKTAGLILIATLLCVSAAASSGPNAVVQWDNAALQGDRDSTLGPPMVARALAMVHTCMYDAWSAYDAQALFLRRVTAFSGVRGRSERWPTSRRRSVMQRIAHWSISFPSINRRCTTR